MKKKIFTRFFAVALISVLLMFAFGIVAVNLNTTNVVNERLREETELAATLLNDKNDFLLFDEYSGSSNFRITVLDTDGNVLYESDTSAALDNHADREEIKNALKGDPKPVKRYSETFKCDMTYYATLTELNDGTDVILRLAVKSSQVTSYITALIPLLVIVLVISVIISLILSEVLSSSISARVTEIGKSLKSLNEGKYAPIKTDTGEPELFAILNEINELNSNIHSQIRIADGERSKLNAVLDNVSQSIIALDRSKRIVFANKSALMMFNGTWRDIGKDLIFLIEDLDIYETVCAHLSENYSFMSSYNGMELSVTVSTVTDETISDDVSAILIVTDVTRERLVEKQKRDFFANASHELKTPITVLQGLSELLMSKEGMDEASAKQIARIHKESLRLGNLISDMLMLSKIESGEAPISTPTELALQTVTEEVISELSEEIKKRDIGVKVIGSASIVADRNMIYELIENIVSNAVKYNKDGGSITVSLTEADGGALLKVEDTGIGIEKEHLPRLCERFYRVDKSHSKRIGGTGLGLAIVKHICAICGAELNIESEPGVGTVVSVAFPANGRNALGD